MNNRELRTKAALFLQATKDRITEIPRTEIESWPNYPATPPFSLDIPPELSGFQFTLMKDLFPDGRIRIAIQSYQYRFLGFGYMNADGFILAKDGSHVPLTEEDMWDLT